MRAELASLNPCAVPFPRPRSGQFELVRLYTIQYTVYTI